MGVLNKNKLASATALKKVFSYKKGAVSLDVTLNIENKEELEDFVCILDAAKKDITKELNK